MVQAKALVFDFIGTLVNAGGYSMDASIAKLHSALVDEGFNTDRALFLKAYGKAHEKYRLVRYGELREVTNAVWVAETLRDLGFEVDLDNLCLKSALNVFFKDYVNSLVLRDNAVELLEKATQAGKIGLISNFTYAPVVYASLRRLGIGKFFNAVVVSGDFGWRKPHGKIFAEALTRLRVSPWEAVFIGDCPVEDIKGAADAGLKAVFVPSQFYTKHDLDVSGVEADVSVSGLDEVCLCFDDVVCV